ncbi:serine hydrolase [Pseudoxanthomonas mexicana]|uniref:serine hydrolase domain-containing protein n=1 Tax=Pseudoxanthomonas mexicana TaxID=128785 RepID=UPI000786120C|nr:serine hydrolase domain-containing protein [Pseudoxanthomonas mexicana]
MPFSFLRCVTVLAAVTSAACASASPVTSSRDADLDATLSAIVKDTGVASVSVARIEDGRIVAVGVAGERAAGQAATRNTRYNVASLTKPVSAEVVLRLASEGRFSLNDRIAEAWVDPDVARDLRHRFLTPRLALAHQTGFPNWRGPSGLAFIADPGGAPGYSGEGYEYVAHYVQARTGARIDQQAQRLLFEPLGLRDTSYTADGTSAGNVASSTRNAQWQAPDTRTRPSAADNLMTTATDYARFVVSVMDGDGIRPSLLAQRGIVQADRRAETCAGIPADVCPDHAGFTLGWELFDFGGTTYYLHTGADEDAFTFVYWTPSTRSGTVILTNSPDGYRAVLPVLESIGADARFVGMLRAQASR